MKGTACIVTGIEDFRWEEFYVFGPGDKDEYEELKKTQPSYTDHYRILSFDDHYDEDNGILANVSRISDKRKFTLPLEDLGTRKKLMYHLASCLQAILNRFSIAKSST